jgi:hypothetical protein
VTGALTYPSGKRCFENDRGCFTFNCSFGASTYAFLWLDDHLVCQSGAYAPKPNTFDGSEGNPLRVLSKSTVVVRLRVYWSPKGHRLKAGDVAARALIDTNKATLGGAACNGTWVNNTDSWGNDYKEVRAGGRVCLLVPVCISLFVNVFVHHCRPPPRTLCTRLLAHTLSTQVDHTTQGTCCDLCVADPKCAGVVWNGPNGPYKDGGCNMKFALSSQTPRTGQLLCRIRPDAPGPPAPPPPPPPAPPATSLDIMVRWAAGYPAGSYTPVAAELVSPTIASEEVTREELQRNLTDGWGTWANSVLDIVLMPEAARLTVGLCQISTGNCITATRPSDTDTMRVAEHAYDKSYVRMFVTFGTLNVSVEFSSGVGPQASSDLELLVTPVGG